MLPGEYNFLESNSAEQQMISKCANPSCSTSFLYLHEGKLFRIDMEAVTDGHTTFGVDPELKKPVRRTEFFWLCHECSRKMTLGFEKGVGVKTIPLARSRAIAS
jgi:hypothetical protein